MKSKIYSIRLLAILLLASAFSQVNAQTTYFVEGFTNTIGHFNSSSADPSVAVGAPFATAQEADHGTWISYGFYRTTGGTPCVTGQELGHPRSVKITNATLPWLATPLASNGINTITFIPGSNNNKYMTIEKTNSLVTDPAAVAAAIWVPVTPEFRMNNCGVDATAGDNQNDTTIVVNDPTATRVRFISRTAYQVDFDSVTMTSTSPIQPVKFTGISAATANGFNKVFWSNATETNTRSYIVEKSVNGIAFTKSTEVTATNARSYSWIDNVPATAVSYYRIKAIDRDGAVTYSAVVKVSSGKKGSEFVVAPNVVSGRSLNLQLNNIGAGNYSLNVTNNSGQMVYRTSILSEGGSVTKTVQLPTSLTAGTYRLQLITGSTAFTQTVVLQ